MAKHLINATADYLRRPCHLIIQYSLLTFIATCELHTKYFEYRPLSLSTKEATCDDFIR